MPGLLAASDRGPLRNSTVLRITALNPSISYSANSPLDLEGREQQCCDTINRIPDTQQFNLYRSQTCWYAFLLLTQGIATTFHQATTVQLRFLYEKLTEQFLYLRCLTSCGNTFLK
ncbi:hypothetical protein TNCV_1707561 [Trichonephila clavipes]|uniref:Uncharacterized protein n=1 Tax=Trichonephila clavipes TaxID=2585209 RepID=A0A8X6RD68_TRICX|nr:hypothetical protein TNCV_1707561 [Trichonephila clavipes]